MAKASADVAITAPRPTATTTSWVQKPRISPKVAKQPRAKPWLSEALITAIAPGPGEKLIAHAAMKKASQSENDIGRFSPPFEGAGPPAGRLARVRRQSAMAKEKSIYSCTECGATSPKWLGKCPGC